MVVLFRSGVFGARKILLLFFCPDATESTVFFARGNAKEDMTLTELCRVTKKGGYVVFSMRTWVDAWFLVSAMFCQKDSEFLDSELVT